MTRESYKGANEANREAIKRKREELGLGPRKPYRVRQLCRVERVKDGAVALIIPGWSSVRQLDVSRSVLPPEWRVVRGLRFYGVVNLAAETAAELFLGDPFEAGGSPARLRKTETRVASAVRAAPKSGRARKGSPPKTAEKRPVPMPLLKRVAQAMKRACIRRVGDEFEKDIDISAQDALRKVNVDSVIRAVLATWIGDSV